MLQYDVIVIGGGIAGLWLGNMILRSGYNVILIEKDKLGAGQTLAAQGMIHGGQKYLLEGITTTQAAVAAKMPARWQACFEGSGEIDLSAVRFLSETQVMWPAGSFLSAAAVLAAAKLMNTAPTRLRHDAVPDALSRRKFTGPVYRLPEKVLDMRSLLLALSSNLQGRIFQGEVVGVLPEGQVTISGETLHAQALIFAAGTGNEHAFHLLGVREPKTQRRPLRQVMVRPLRLPLFGHGIVSSARPRITVTSHPQEEGAYVWYLGGNVAEEGANMDETQALRFAKRELTNLFPEIDWDGRQWASWCGDRAEPLDGKGELPPGPFVHQHGRVLLAWPTKLTFAPALSDLVFARLRDIKPVGKATSPPLPPAVVGSYPWELAAWHSVAEYA